MIVARHLLLESACSDIVPTTYYSTLNTVYGSYRVAGLIERLPSLTLPIWYVLGFEPSGSNPDRIKPVT